MSGVHRLWGSMCIPARAPPLGKDGNSLAGAEQSHGVTQLFVSQHGSGLRVGLQVAWTELETAFSVPFS